MITIIVCSNRIQLLKSCINRLAHDFNISKCYVDIHYQFKSEYEKEELDNIQLPTNFRIFYTDKDLIYCRNKSITECRSKYALILDDDDYLSPNSIPMLNSYAERYPDVGMINFRYEKLGRFDFSNHDDIVIDSDNLRTHFLSDFNLYDYSRCNCVYLSNGHSLINASMIPWLGIEWKYLYCDDILPITRLYASTTCIKSSYVVGYYDTQNTICKKKSESDLRFLESNMLKSYQELLSLGINRDLVARSLFNSIRQMEEIDGYNPDTLYQLKNLLHEHSITKGQLPSRIFDLNVPHP